MIESRPHIAVLVLNYNGLQFLDACFNALVQQTYQNLTVYLVDNGSSDESLTFTRQHYPSVKIITFERNIGFAEAYNRAVHCIDEPLVYFLNNDTACSPDCLEHLLHELLAHPDAAAAGSRMLFADNPSLINHGGGLFTLTGIGLDKDFGKDRSGPDIPSNPFYTAYACGGALLIWREQFLEAGEFDAEYFIYFEDVDLCFRLWLLGYKVIHVPSSVVLHYFSPVFGKESPMKIYLCQKNRLANMVKHLSFSYLLKALVLSLGYDLNRIVGWIRSGDGQKIAATIRGIFTTFSNLPRLIHARQMIRRKQNIPIGWLRSQGLLLTLSDSLKELNRLKAVKKELF